MKKDPLIFLKHILESISDIEEFLQGKTKEEFKRNKLIHDAVIHRLEIVGEAAKNIPKSFRENYPDVPWTKMTGTRDKLIHEYFGIDYNLAYDIVMLHLPLVKKLLLKIIKETELSDK